LSGGRKVIENYCKKEQAPLDTLIATAEMTSKGQSFCKNLTSTSILFVQWLFTFMEEEHTRQKASSTLDASSRWLWVTSMVRIFFSELSLVRSGPSLISPQYALQPRSAARFLWATVQAHRVMEEFKKLDFRLHPSIAPILTSQLVEICASCVDLENLKETLQLETKKAASDASNAMKEAKSAASLANEAKRQADRAARNKRGRGDRGADDDDH
jgi:hypothetical protein